MLFAKGRNAVVHQLLQGVRTYEARCSSWVDEKTMTLFSTDIEVALQHIYLITSMENCKVEGCSVASRSKGPRGCA